MIQVPAKVSNLLIVQPGSIGDVILTLPTIAQLRLNFPKSKIHWAIEEKAYPIVKHQPDIRFHIFSESKLKVKAPLSTFYQILKLRQSLHREAIDLVVDLQGFFQSGLVTKLSGARLKVGFHRKNTRRGNCLFLDTTLPHIPERSLHRVDFFQRVIPALGGQLFALNDPFQFKFLEEEEKGLKNLLHRLRIKNPYFVLHVGSRSQAKRWTARGFFELIPLIRKQYPKHSILLTGAGKEDHDFEREILKNIEPQMVQSSINKINLRELALIIKNAGFLVAGDSPALHLGSAFKTPSIGLFGRTNPQQYGPYTPGYAGLRHTVPCYPCQKNFCSHHSCMNNLASNVVFRNLALLYRFGENK